MKVWTYIKQVGYGIESLFVVLIETRVAWAQAISKIRMLEATDKNDVEIVNEALGIAQTVKTYGVTNLQLDQAIRYWMERKA